MRQRAQKRIAIGLVQRLASLADGEILLISQCQWARHRLASHHIAHALDGRARHVVP